MSYLEKVLLQATLKKCAFSELLKFMYYKVEDCGKCFLRKTIRDFCCWFA